jgi:phosphomannomutase
MKTEKIFKAYDIRGTVPDELDDQTAYEIGRALAATQKMKQVAVGRDMRTHSDRLFGEVARGLEDEGTNVVDVGRCSTDALYFAVGKFGYDGGVMITASHNPPRYNGFKICGRDAVPLSNDRELLAMREWIRAGVPTAAGPKGGRSARDIRAAYADHVLGFIDSTRIKPFRVVIDAGNGMAGAMLPPVLEQLPIKAERLYFELDGTFPNHLASPIEPENTETLRRRVVESGADLGCAFDGDADRMFLCDARGGMLGGDMVVCLVARKLLQADPHQTILYNLICSHAVPELIRRMGGTALRTRVGHALIKPLMREHGAVFGGEHSGHFYFRDNWYADSGLVAFLVALEVISQEGRPLAEIVREFDPYVRSGEINSEVRDAQGRLRALEERYAGGQIDHLDGLTVEFPDWWFNVRPSNTEPLLRLNIEAADADTLRRKQEELLALIRA